MGRLDGKVAVITGVAGGIGGAAAELFAAEGAKVVGVDLVAGTGCDLDVQADVTDPEQVQGAYTQAREAFGRIDVLFNNAGISPNDDASVLDTSLEAWQRVQDVNLKSVFLCCKHGIPHLLDNDGPLRGSVINTASFVATMGAATSQISYTASKGGVLAMSREMGVEFARNGVRGQRAVPGTGRHAAAARAVRQGPRAGPAAARSRPRRPLRAGARDRPGRPVPRLRRVVLRDRVDVPRRRRDLGRLRDARVAHGRSVACASGSQRRLSGDAVSPWTTIEATTHTATVQNSTASSPAAKPPTPIA